MAPSVAELKAQGKLKSAPPSLKPTLKLTRVIQWWECSNCKRLHGNYPEKCVCNHFPPVFVQKDAPLDDALPRADYLVEKNFLFEGQHCEAGIVVSLIVEDQSTRDLLARHLVRKLKEDKEVK